MNFKQVVEETRETSMKETTATLSDDGLTYVEPITVIYRFTEQELDQAMTKAAMAVVEEMQNKVTTYQYVSSKCDCDEYSRTGCSHIGKETAFELITNELSNLKQQLSEKEALSALKE